MVRVGVIGCGYWGPNLIRCFSEAEGSTVEALATCGLCSLPIA
jgi:hypothetical protein